MNSKVHDFTSEIAGTKQDLVRLSDQLEHHLRSASPYFKNIGPFRASESNQIGVITKYYRNYEFSMELKYGSMQATGNSYMQMLQGTVSIITAYFLDNYHLIPFLYS